MPEVSLFDDEKDPILVQEGETIFNAAEFGDRMYVVIEGEVDIKIRDKVIETVGPGGIFGEMALIDNKPRSAAAQARSDCRLAGVDQERFMFLVQNTPTFAIQIMRAMSDRLRRQNVERYGE